MTAGGTPGHGPPLLEVRGLEKVFSRRRLFGPAHETCAARAVSFGIARGEAVALVGESGSGKSTIARMLLRLVKPDRGTIVLAGENVLEREPRRASLDYRGRVQMVFQDPFGSLNPVHDVGHHLARPLLRHGAPSPARDVARHVGGPPDRHEARRSRRARIPRAELEARVLELLRTVGLEPPGDFVRRYPHELSGGQRQRVAIARALAVNPQVLVADEPTSMLDVSIRMGVLNLLARLKRERGLAILLITHDLASARYLADRILVLYRGRVVEEGAAAAVVEAPAHPYTRALLAAIAGVGSGSAAETRPAAVGAAPAAGCPFAARCPDRLDACLVTDPEARRVGDRSIRCHLYPAGSAPERAS